MSDSNRRTFLKKAPAVAMAAAVAAPATAAAQGATDKPTKKVHYASGKPPEKPPDLKDYDAMNEMYQGRFGAEPGVRTTIAAAGGIPGNSLVEIDCIAYI